MKIASKAIAGGKRHLSKLPRVIGIPRLNGNKEGDAPLSAREVKSIREQVQDCIARKGGQASSSVQAAKLANQYGDWGLEEKRRFLQLLLEEFDLDEAKATEAVHMGNSLSGEELRKTSQALRRALVPARVELLRQWTLMPGGVKFLVDLRVDIIDAIKAGLPFKPLDADLKELLESLFSVGILQMHAIRWDSPAALLEKLIAYEAVHAIQSWDDLKNRLDADRRCYAFFHPNMPNEPLIFIEVALCRGIADNVLRLLDTSATVLNPIDTNTAIFFSISNTQKGLAGIPFGDFLIKQVVKQLEHDVPNVKRYATLSPMPGFRRWMESEEGAAKLANIDPKVLLAAGCESPEAALEQLKALDLTNAEASTENFQELVKGLAMHYLAEAKRPGRGTASDPVAHFHLSNGARIEQINWGANLTERGMKESYGLMVNYRYKLERIERHHEDYVHQGTVYVGKAVRSLRLKPKPVKKAPRRLSRKRTEEPIPVEKS